MIENIPAKTTIKHIVEGKVIKLECDSDTLTSHIKEALANFMAHCVNYENAIAQAKQAAVEAQPVPPIEAKNEQCSNS